MKFKRCISLILLIAILLPFANYEAVAAESSQDIIKRINSYIKDFYNTNSDFYDINSVNHSYIKSEWNRNVSNGNMYLFNPVPYGSSGTETVGGYWGNVSRKIIGRDKFGNTIVPYTDASGNRNEDFYKWPSGWSGNPIAVSSKLVKFDDRALNRWWRNNRTQAEINTMSNTSYSGTRLTGTKREMMNKAIQKGIDFVYAGIQAQQVDARRSGQTALVHIEGSSPPNGEWVEYILIIVPPTNVSWGMGWRFNSDGGSYRNLEIPIAPFNMVAEDIVVSYEQYSSSAVPGDTVEFKALAKADSSHQGVSYTWKITDKNGKPIPGVSYSGHSNPGASGTFNISGGHSSQHRASFKMPDYDVVVSFEVNGDKRVNEVDYENNRSVIDPVTVKVLKEGPPINAGEYVLDYDIYARRIKYGTKMVANFPTGLSYTGTGSANYYISNTGNLAKNLSLSGGKSVTSAPFETQATAIATLYRDAVGDKPANRAWLANGVYTSSDKLRLTGSAWRNYIYNFKTAKGSSESVVIRHYEAFNPVGLTVSAPVKVYNGMPTISPKYISSGASNAHLEWQSGAINFNVTREMFLMDENGNRTNKINVPGQYTRTFYGKNTADITWGATKSMAAAYSKDRATAKSNGRNYDLAVFSTGKDFHNVAYPLKSGYMFTPSATYVCTVKSSVFVDKDASEEEKMRVHRELVDKVKKSFIYDNQLTYTNTGNDAYSFRNITYANTGGILSIKTSDKKSVVMASNSLYEPYMEGYAASGTASSYDNYRYREFVGTQEASRIDAETVITFTISSSAKRYTKIDMKDGNYNITAKSNPFTFQGMTVPQRNLADGITVTVRGSLYDDRG